MRWPRISSPPSHPDFYRGTPVLTAAAVVRIFSSGPIFSAAPPANGRAAVVRQRGQMRGFGGRAAGTGSGGLAHIGRITVRHGRSGAALSSCDSLEGWCVGRSPLAKWVYVASGMVCRRGGSRPVAQERPDG
jgi:hypothetical protein